MGPQEADYVETVVTCVGDYYDPEFPSQLRQFRQRLQKLLVPDSQKLIVKKVEPWNSVRVTFNIPKEAAQRLQQLAQQGDRALRELGILAVQVEGDQIISLTIAGRNNEKTELVFRTTQAASSVGAPQPGPSTSFSSADEAGVPGPGRSEATRKNIAHYLSQQGGTSVFDSLFGGSESDVFKSPNVVAPHGNSLPFPQPMNSPGATGTYNFSPGRTPPGYPSPPGGMPAQVAHPGMASQRHPTQMGRPLTSSSPLLVNLLQADMSLGHMNNFQSRQMSELFFGEAQGQVPKKRRRPRKSKDGSDKRSSSPGSAATSPGQAETSRATNSPRASTSVELDPLQQRLMDERIMESINSVALGTSRQFTNNENPMNVESSETHSDANAIGQPAKESEVKLEQTFVLSENDQSIHRTSTDSLAVSVENILPQNVDQSSENKEAVSNSKMTEESTSFMQNISNSQVLDNVEQSGSVGHVSTASASSVSLVTSDTSNLGHFSVKIGESVTNNISMSGDVRNIAVDMNSLRNIAPVTPPAEVESTNEGSHIRLPLDQTSENVHSSQFFSHAPSGQHGTLANDIDRNHIDGGGESHDITHGNKNEQGNKASEPNSVEPFMHTRIGDVQNCTLTSSVGMSPQSAGTASSESPQSTPILSNNDHDLNITTVGCVLEEHTNPQISKSYDPEWPVSSVSDLHHSLNTGLSTKMLNEDLALIKSGMSGQKSNTLSESDANHMSKLGSGINTSDHSDIVSDVKRLESPTNLLSSTDTNSQDAMEVDETKGEAASTSLKPCTVSTQAESMEVETDILSDQTKSSTSEHQLSLEPGSSIVISTAVLEKQSNDESSRLVYESQCDKTDTDQISTPSSNEQSEAPSVEALDIKSHSHKERIDSVVTHSLESSSHTLNGPPESSSPSPPSPAKICKHSQNEGAALDELSMQSSLDQSTSISDAHTDRSVSLSGSHVPEMDSGVNTSHIDTVKKTSETSEQIRVSTPPTTTSVEEMSSEIDSVPPAGAPDTGKDGNVQSSLTEAVIEPLVESEIETKTISPPSSNQTVSPTEAVDSTSPAQDTPTTCDDTPQPPVPAEEQLMTEPKVAQPSEVLETQQHEQISEEEVVTDLDTQKLPDMHEATIDETTDKPSLVTSSESSNSEQPDLAATEEPITSQPLRVDTSLNCDDNAGMSSAEDDVLLISPVKTESSGLSAIFQQYGVDSPSSSGSKPQSPNQTPDVASSQSPKCSATDGDEVSHQATVAVEHSCEDVTSNVGEIPPGESAHLVNCHDSEDSKQVSSGTPAPSVDNGEIDIRSEESDQPKPSVPASDDLCAQQNASEQRHTSTTHSDSNIVQSSTESAEHTDSEKTANQDASRSRRRQKSGNISIMKPLIDRNAALEKDGMMNHEEPRPTESLPIVIKVGQTSKPVVSGTVSCTSAPQPTVAKSSFSIDSILDVNSSSKPTRDPINSVPQLVHSALSTGNVSRGIEKQSRLHATPPIDPVFSSAVVSSHMLNNSIDSIPGVGTPYARNAKSNIHINFLQKSLQTPSSVLNSMTNPQFANKLTDSVRNAMKTEEPYIQVVKPIATHAMQGIKTGIVQPMVINDIHPQISHGLVSSKETLSLMLSPPLRLSATGDLSPPLKSKSSAFTVPAATVSENEIAYAPRTLLHTSDMSSLELLANAAKAHAVHNQSPPKSLKSPVLQQKETAVLVTKNNNASRVSPLNQDANSFPSTVHGEAVGNGPTPDVNKLSPTPVAPLEVCDNGVSLPTATSSSNVSPVNQDAMPAQFDQQSKDQSSDDVESPTVSSDTTDKTKITAETQQENISMKRKTSESDTATENSTPELSQPDVPVKRAKTSPAEEKPVKNDLHLRKENNNVGSPASTGSMDVAGDLPVARSVDTDKQEVTASDSESTRRRNDSGASTSTCKSDRDDEVGRVTRHPLKQGSEVSPHGNERSHHPATRHSETDSTPVRSSSRSTRSRVSESSPESKTPEVKNVDERSNDSVISETNSTDAKVLRTSRNAKRKLGCEDENCESGEKKSKGEEDAENEATMNTRSTRGNRSNLRNNTKEQPVPERVATRRGGKKEEPAPPVMSNKKQSDVGSTPGKLSANERRSTRSKGQADLVALPNPYRQRPAKSKR